jgi:predicted transcriptional regulator
MWYPSFDADGDPLKYDVEIFDNQNVSVAYNLTNFYVTSWEVAPALQDGQTYHWRVRANDTLGQINSTGPWSSFWYFTIDISPPSILTSSADFTTYTGNDFNIYANFTDNTGVVFSNLYYKKSSDINYTLQPMIESIPDQFYVSHDLLAINTTNDDDDYFYYIIAEDLAGNEFNYSKGTGIDFQITVLDNIPPNVQYGSGNITTTTDDEFTIFIYCNDNIGTTKATIYIRKIGDLWQFMDLNKYYFSNYIINYSDLKSNLGFNTSDGIDCEYYILVYDASNNFYNYSNPLGEPWEIEVLDNDVPDIGQGSGNLEVTTDDPFTIFANFTDNVGVTSAVIFVRETASIDLNWYNTNMLEVSNNNFTVNYDELKSLPGLQMNTSPGGVYEYYVLAYDETNNSCNYTQDLQTPWNIIATDNDPPSLINCSGNFEIGPDDPFIITAEFTDNVAVSNVKIFLYHSEGDQLPSGGSWLNTWMTPDLTGGFGSFSISYETIKSELGIDTSKGGSIKYYFVASDPTSNEYRYPEGSNGFLNISIENNDFPIIFDGAGNLTVYTGEDFTIFIDFYNDLEVISSTLYFLPANLIENYQNNDWTEFNMVYADSPLGNEYIRYTASNLELNIDTTYSNLNFYYYISAMMGNGQSANFGTSYSPYRITIIDNMAPTVVSWFSNPEILTADHPSDLIVTVNVSDIGGSGFDEQNVMISYKRGTFDLTFTELIYMEKISTYLDSNNKIYSDWQFTIPRPKLDGSDNSMLDGWELIKGENISIRFRYSDMDGNSADSNILDKYVTPVRINHAPIVHLIAPNGNEYFTNLQYIFWSASDIDDDPLRITIEISDDNGQTWNVVATDLENTGRYLMNTTTFAEGTTYLIKITVSDGELSDVDSSETTFTISRTVFPTENEVPDGELGSEDNDTDIIPFIIAGIIIALIAACAGFIGGTEVGKFKFYSLILIPLYSKLHHDEVLDHFVRGQIFGYIKANPGEHYNAIKESLELTNGTLSHHLKILEKEEYIYSKRDKFYSRFYPKGMKITPLDAAQLNKIQKIIVNKIRERPGLTQHEIITILGTSQQVVSYNLTKLTRDNVLSIKKDGREKRYYLNHVESDPTVTPSSPTVISQAQNQPPQEQPQAVSSQAPAPTPVVVSQESQSDGSQPNENNIPKGQ